MDIPLPIRIMKMIKILHNKGYCNIYLYSGMSPSGMNWRYMIGKTAFGHWPKNETLASGSIRTEGDIEWSDGTSSAEKLAEDFINKYELEVSKPCSGDEEYNRWYAATLDMLGEKEILTFYADYEAPHEYLLKYAPGFKK